ncbi:MAG TPA: restriction endonuclease subunit S [Methylophilaceae bacterium]
MIDLGDLPPSWTVAPLSELTEYVQRGKSPKYTDISDLPVINQKCVRWGGLDTKHVKYIHSDQQRSTEAVRFLRVDDILWNSTGTGTIGRACLYRGEFPQAVVDSHVTIVRSDHRLLEPKYLHFFIMSSAVQDEIENIQSGSTNQVELSRKAILELPIPLPPPGEQRRIVEKIEALFAELDKGEESLRQVQTLLARYRQSVLKAAVTGELTADWRARHAGKLEHGRDLLARILKARRENWQGRGKYKEPVEPDTSSLPELPEGWVWATVGQIADVIGGLTKNSKRVSMPLRRPMLRVANVYQNRLDLSDIHETGLTESELERALLKPLDLLVVEGNGSKDQIGRMALWRGEIPGAVHQNHLIKVRLIEKGMVEFLLWWFQSPDGRQMIEMVASSSSGLHTLSISKIESFAVPLPSLDEAQEITSQVREALLRIEQLNIYTEAELRRSAALRRSILKDAFVGRLVPQDPTEEPATELIARIRAQRSAEPHKSGRRKLTA